MSGIWVPDYPRAVPQLDGDPTSVEECATVLLRACATLDDVDSESMTQTTDETWQGEAASAYRERVREVAKDAAAASAAVRSAAKAVHDYSDELARLRFHHDSLVEWRTGLVSTISYLKAQQGTLLTHEASQLTQAAQDARRSCDAFTTECGDLERAAATNSSELIAALQGLMTVADGRKLAAGGDIADAVMARPGAPGTGASAQEVADWWRSLSDEEQFAVIAAYPEVIGAADGLPASARDEANRLLLDQDLAALEIAERTGELTAEQRAHADNIRAAAEAIANAEGRSGENVDLSIDPITGEPIPVFLLLYQPGKFGNDGAVAMAIGNPDTADNVAVSVPGIGTDGTSIPKYAEQAQNLYESARLSDPHTTSATIAWIGYDHPTDWDYGNTITESAAIDGGKRLADYIDGLQASRTQEPRVMTVIGHSYGSTTSAHAASDHGLDVDNLALIGSPGAGGGIDHASQLNVPQVWAGNSSRDFVAALADNGWVGNGTFFGAGLGNDVAEDTFGANRFTAEDETRNSTFRNTGDHLKYYDRGTESIFNLGQIMVGDYDEVMVAEHTYDPWWGPPVDPEASRDPLPLQDDRKPD